MGEHEYSIDVGAVTDAVLATILASPGRGGIPENDDRSESDARERIRARVELAASEPDLDAPGARLARLSELLGDNGWSGPVASMSPDPFDPRREPRRALPLIVAVIALAVLLIASIWAFTSNTPADEPDRAPKVDLVIDADGIADGAALPGTLELAGAGDPVSLEFDTDRLSLGELEPGDYTVTLAQTPVLEDGTTFVMDDEASFTIEAEDGDREVPVKLDAVKVEDLSDETRLGLADRAEKAHADDLMALLRSDGTAENPDETAQPEDAPADEPAADPDGGSTPQKPADKPQKGDIPSKPAGGQTSSKPSGGSNGGGTSKPSHQHAWVHHDAVYKTVHHDAVYNNVWHPPVKKTVVVCLDCGAIDPGYQHMKEHVLAGGNGGTTTKTIVVQEGYNEQVLVSAAWDEQVLVSNAYDECSCGARK